MNRNNTMNDPALTLDEAKAVVATKTAPRVTEESIRAKIKNIDYFTHGTLTVCIITLVTGWMQIGKSAPASPANYDPEVGRRYAFEDAFKPLWQLEGYALCNTLWRGSDTAT